MTSKIVNIGRGREDRAKEGAGQSEGVSNLFMRLNRTSKVEDKKEKIEPRRGGGQRKVVSNLSMRLRTTSKIEDKKEKIQPRRVEDRGRVSVICQ